MCTSLLCAECVRVRVLQVGSYVLPLYPRSSAGCHPLTTDPDILHGAIAQGLAAVNELFSWHPASSSFQAGAEAGSGGQAGGGWGCEVVSTPGELGFHR